MPAVIALMAILMLFIAPVVSKSLEYRRASDKAEFMVTDTMAMAGMDMSDADMNGGNMSAMPEQDDSLLRRTLAVMVALVMRSLGVCIMPNYALIKDNPVVNIIVWDGDENNWKPAEEFKTAEIKETDFVYMGYIYDPQAIRSPLLLLLNNGDALWLLDMIPQIPFHQIL